MLCLLLVPRAATASLPADWFQWAAPTRRSQRPQFRSPTTRQAHANSALSKMAFCVRILRQLVTPAARLRLWPWSAAVARRSALWLLGLSCSKLSQAITWGRVKAGSTRRQRLVLLFIFGKEMAYPAFSENQEMIAGSHHLYPRSS